jgi:hypothetical protein
MRLFHRERKMVEAANESGNFSTLVSAVKTADLVDALDAPGPLTLFAPTDEAFRKLPKGTVEQLMSDRAMLRSVLQHHVVSGKVTTKDAISTHSYRALDGSELNIDTCEGMNVNGAKVVEADIAVRNGVIHAIDTVLMPGMETTKPAMAGMETERMTGTSTGTGAKVAAGTAATGVGVGAAVTSTKEKTVATAKEPAGAMKETTVATKEKVTQSAENIPGSEKVAGAGAAVAGGAGATAAAAKEKMPGMGGKDLKPMDSELRKLQSMKDSGQISEAEFQARKKDLMSGKM